MEIKLENMATGKSISLGLKGEYLIQEKDLGTAQGLHGTTQYIERLGSHVDGTSLGARDISITGLIRIRASESMAERKNLLNRLINPRHDIKLYYKDYVLIVRPDTSVKYSNNKHDNGNKLCKFLIQATAHRPLFKLRNPKVYHEAKIKPAPLFPLRIPKKKGIAFGYIPAISIGNVLNPGDVETGFVIKFVATEGAVTNPKILNNLTGKYIELILEMNLGDVVEVSTVSGDKYAKLTRGTAEVDLFKCISKRSSMSMTLNVGINDLTIGASGNGVNMSTSISFTPEWLEVQE